MNWASPLLTLSRFLKPEKFCWTHCKLAIDIHKNHIQFRRKKVPSEIWWSYSHCRISEMGQFSETWESTSGTFSEFINGWLPRYCCFTFTAHEEITFALCIVSWDDLDYGCAYYTNLLAAQSIAGERIQFRSVRDAFSAPCGRASWLFFYQYHHHDECREPHYAP